MTMSIQQHKPVISQVTRILKYSRTVSDRSKQSQIPCHVLWMSDLWRTCRSLRLLILNWFKYQQVLGLLNELCPLVLKSFLLFFFQTILLHLSSSLLLSSICRCRCHSQEYNFKPVYSTLTQCHSSLVVRALEYHDGINGLNPGSGFWFWCTTNPPSCMGTCIAGSQRQLGVLLATSLPCVPWLWKPLCRDSYQPQGTLWSVVELCNLITLT